MTSVSTIPASSTLESLGLQPGDSLIVDQVEGDMFTVSLAQQGKRSTTALTTPQFLDKWTGKFPTPEPDPDNPRLAHILAKHVK